MMVSMVGVLSIFSTRVWVNSHDLHFTKDPGSKGLPGNPSVSILATVKNRAEKYPSQGWTCLPPYRLQHTADCVPVTGLKLY